jgi:polysaccharide export outer membrane protein
MPMRFKILCFLSIISLCYSCSLKQQHALFLEKGKSATDTASKNSHSVYRIQPEDVLQIRNLQGIKYLDGSSTNASGGSSSSGESFQVEEDGRVTLPIVGRVFVTGLSRYEAAQKIEKIYRDSLLKDPIIELKILNLKVTLFGEARGTGNYTLKKENTSLIDILGDAGGLTNAADEKNVRIIRGDRAHPEVIKLDLSDINVLGDPRIILQNNDIIYIGQNKRAIRDDKIQNVSSLVQPSLLIFNTALIIYSLFR